MLMKTHFEETWNPAHMQLSGRTPISSEDYIQYLHDGKRVNLKTTQK
jgi:hypothetical protein